MDIKLVILIVIIFILLYWEITNIKKEIIDNHKKIIQTINNQIDELNKIIENNNDDICLKTKQYIDECSKNIKNSNNENINQLKKINILNQQPIKKIYNHFAERDETLCRSDENESAIDENNNTQVITKKNDTLCYLSDDITCHSKKINTQINGNKKIDDIKTDVNIYTKLYNCENNNYMNHHSQTCETKSSNSTCNQQNNNIEKLEQNNIEKSEQIKIEKSGQNNIEKQEYNVIEKQEYNIIESPILYPIKIDDDLFPTCEKITENVTCSITMISNIPAELIAEFKYNPIVDKSISSELDMCDKCETSESSNNNVKKPTNILNDITTNNDDEILSSSSSSHDKIKNNLDVLKKEMENEIPILKKSSSEENIFIQHNEKDKINIDDILQKIPTCSYNDLKNIAKKFSLPVTQKIGNRWIIYKKIELCDILKDHIMSLQKQAD